MKTNFFFPLLLIALLVSTSTNAQVKTWIELDGDWNNPNNWQPHGVPGPQDYVVIGGPTVQVKVTMSGSRSCRQIKIDNASRLTITTGSTLVLQDPNTQGIMIRSTFYPGDTALINYGNIYIGALIPDHNYGIEVDDNCLFVNKSGANIFLSGIDGYGSAPAIMLSNGRFRNEGNIHLGSMTNINAGIGLDNGSTFLNKPAGAIDINLTAGNGLNVKGASTFLNEGTLQIGNTNLISGKGITLSNGVMDNSPTGIIEINRTGIMGMEVNGTDGSFTNSGILRIGADQLLTVPACSIDNFGKFNNGPNSSFQIRTTDKAIRIYHDATLINYAAIALDTAGTGIEIEDDGIGNGPILTNTISGTIRISRSTYGLKAKKNGLVINDGTIRLSRIADTAMVIDNSELRNNRDIILDTTGLGIAASNTALVNNLGIAKIQINQSASRAAIQVRDSATKFINDAKIIAGDVSDIGQVGIDLWTGAQFENRNSGIIELDRVTGGTAGAIEARGSQILLRNQGHITIGYKQTINNPALSFFLSSVLQNDPGGTISVKTTGRALWILVRSKINNSGIIVVDTAYTAAELNADGSGPGTEFNNMQGGIFDCKKSAYGILLFDSAAVNNNGNILLAKTQNASIYSSNSFLNNYGFIKTGLDSAANSQHGFFFDHKSVLNNFSPGKIEINGVQPGYHGLIAKAESSVNNSGSITFGQYRSFNGNIALDVIENSSFSNLPNSKTQFINCADNAIAWDGLHANPLSSKIINKGTFSFGNVTNWALYNSDTATLFTNEGIMETLTNGKMYLEAKLYNNPGAEIRALSGTATIKLPLDNRGTVNIGGTLVNESVVSNNNLVINNGTINCPGLFSNNGTYKGNGLFRYSVFNNAGNGKVSPGNSPGCLNFADGFITTQSNNQVIAEINGKNNPCTEFDRVVVNGNATISGALLVSFGGGYTPAQGDRITILKSSSLSGTFNTTNLPGAWTILYNFPATGDVTLNFGALLPLKLLSFSVTPKGPDALLKWTTDNETNTQLFEVERSENGNVFHTLGSVSAMNTGGIHAYEFTDTKPAHGLNYYRLKMVDTDGSFTYSMIVVMQMNADETYVMTAYPNPAKDVLNITVSENNPALTAELFSVTGVKVSAKALPTPGTYQMDIRILPPGIYLLKAGKAGVIKIIKQ